MNEYQVRFPVKIQYKKHKTNGKGYTAFPTYNAEGKSKRKFVYFPGKYNSPESKEAFDKFYREVMTLQPELNNGAYHYTVGEVVHAWIQDQLKGTMAAWSKIVGGLLMKYATIPANEFNNRHYKQCVETICKTAADTGRWNKSSVNKIIGMIHDIFRFGAEEAMCDESVLANIKTVRTYKMIRKYGERIRPESEMYVASQADIDAVLESTNPVLRTMIIVALETGMRPGELATLNKDEINEHWQYIPVKHKNAFRGQLRSAIPLNTLCREALNALELIRPDKLNRYYFTVREAIAFNHQARRKELFTPEIVSVLNKPFGVCEAARKLDVSHTAITKWRKELQNGDFSVNRFFNETKVRGSQLFNRNKFYRHLESACKKAGVQRFCPYSFRHKVGQEVRDKYGIEAASALLGHKQLNTTQLYAKKAEKLASEISTLLQDRDSE